jgi:tetraacyldisaccharide 4'-kinase
VNIASRAAVSMLSGFYSGASMAQRRRAARRPDLRRRLRRPVVSIGNLALGGSAKTPVVAHVATLLRDAGEHPAILSRGYARTRIEDGVVVVRTAAGIVADLAIAGDEPLMLARSLDGVSVLVAEDRHLAGALAEARLGCTVHVLDDGFQHFRLARDVDLLLVTPDDLHRGRVVPAGRLREPVVAARYASALLVVDGGVSDIARVAETLGVESRFEVRRRQTVPRMLDPYGTPPRQPRSAPALAAAGIARPDRFVSDLTAGGWNIVGSVAFPDHHAYSRHDVERIAAMLHETGATLVLTTEKDLVRWLPLSPLPFALAWVPLEVTVEPADVFQSWLLSRTFPAP